MALPPGITSPPPPGRNPSAVWTANPTPSVVSGVPGTATKGVTVPFDYKMHAPGPSGPATSPTGVGYSPLSKSGWTAGSLTPRVTPQTQPLAGASRFSPLQGSLGSTYSRVMANPNAPSGGTTPTGAPGAIIESPGFGPGSDLPAWLKTQMEQIQNYENRTGQPVQVIQGYAPRAASVVVDPLANLKAQLLNQELAYQRSLAQQEADVISRANTGAIYAGAVADQWMRNRTMSPMNPSGGPSMNINPMTGASTMLNWGNNLNPAAPTVYQAGQPVTGSVARTPATEYMPPGWYAGRANTYGATSIPSTQVSTPLPLNDISMTNLNVVNSMSRQPYIPRNLVW